MASKTVKFSYYRPLFFPGNALCDLTDTLKFLEIQTPQNRTIRHFGDIIQLARIHNDNGIWKLQFARYRTGIVPERGNPLTVEFAPIDLPEGFSLAELSSVLYDPTPELNILYLQQNKNAVTRKTIETYFSTYLEAQNTNATGNQTPLQLNLDMIMRPNAFDDIRRLGSIKALTISFKNSRDQRIEEVAAGNSIEQVLNVARELGQNHETSLTFEVKIKQSRTFDSTLSHTQVINTIRPFVDLVDTNSNIRKIEVKGIEEEGEKTLPIDLSSYQLYDTETFNIPRGQAISREDIEGFMYRKYFERREYLLRILT